MTYLCGRWVEVFLKCGDLHSSWLDVNQTNQLWQSWLVVYGGGKGEGALTWEAKPWDLCLIFKGGEGVHPG